MLAQNFMTAADLGITEPQRDALIKTLALMDGGKLVHVDNDDINGDVICRDNRTFSGAFNMGAWAGATECGTAACIGGTAELIGGVQFGRNDFGCGIESHALENLFYPPNQTYRFYGSITVPQAAMALRSYLTTGDARWDLALAES